MSQIAIFSDVHGNLPALKAVLNDIENRQVDQVYCLGDLVDFAPWTNEVIDLIREQHIPCLMGNHDERIAFNHPIIPLQKHSPDETQARRLAIEHTQKTISDYNKEYLATLPAQIRLTYSLDTEPVNILLVHASVESNTRYIYPDHNESDLRNMMRQEQATALVMGHTHLSYIREVVDHDSKHQKLAINCGSVGRSKEGHPLATYLLLNVSDRHISSRLVHLKYPVTETVRAIKESPIPDFYADFLIGNIMTR